MADEWREAVDTKLEQLEASIPSTAWLFADKATARWLETVQAGHTKFNNKVTIDGTADDNQLVIQAHSTQSNSNPLIRLEDSSAALLLGIHSDHYSNVFMGYEAGIDNVDDWASDEGVRLVFQGYRAGTTNTTGERCTAVGFEALTLNLSGDENTALGSEALETNSTGDDNVAVGSQALKANTGSRNVAVGSSALLSITSGTNSVAVGFQALRLSTGTGSVGVGAYALDGTTSGNYNVAVGHGAGNANSTGAENVFVGHSAGFSSTGGTTTAVGSEAGYSMTAGTGGVFLGYKAGYNEVNSDRLFICNSDTNTPLIYGVFPDYVRVYGADDSTGAIKDVFYVSHVTSGTPGVGFGVAIDWLLQSSTTNDQIACKLIADWIDGTHATRKARFSIQPYDTAPRPTLICQASGSAAMIGFLGANPIVRQAHIVDADGNLADITTKFNTLLGYLETYGLLATS